ncbi:type VII secretion protein EccCa [Solirubrobacter sp. CPCC 204708]|uniref:Type VII secretion protein EccCa n=1 Tax=Solirubrobacter deserti TaxID=2282478 RepID=A0ABT4RGC0_9ACTN|nr:type VII secretion protein EccCa [Solirubrobacter deserti]MBE2319678.1 type VII secretion protein EccCa [Solirubrobacter deserti]MDA0137583.1 type VII secretion protein EccCa [Solirubrobacter deserti]
MTRPQTDTLHRPPRAYPPAVPSDKLRLAAPPTEPQPPQVGIISLLFPVVGGVGMLGFAIAYGSSTFLYIAGAMICLLLLFSIGMRWSQKRMVRKRAAADARRYADYLRQTDRELAVAGELQRGALARLYPEAKQLWTQLVKGRDVWERRPHDKDFLHVRIGEGTVELDKQVEFDLGMNVLAEYQKQSLHEAKRLIERRTKLRNEPVVVDLADCGVLAVTGERTRARAWARGLMVQLAAARAPHDLRLITYFEAEHATDWEWGKWLPHQRVDPGAGPSAGLTLTRTPAELEALLERELKPRADHLRRLSEADSHTRRNFELAAPELVVLVDGFTPDGEIAGGTSFKELLARARELKCVLVLLADARELEPSHIDARLTVPERGLGGWEVWGQDAPSIPEVRIDEVDLGIAEAIARTLAPLRLAEGDSDGERGLGASVRLVELLGADGVEAVPPAPPHRPREQALRAPIGRTKTGEVLWLDLKQAAEEGMGPHGVLVGATGSGKSELLRSLVAGLAATHDPEQLAFVLVDYKGGAAFAELSRLPHVAGMITNLSQDLSLVDRMRDALIGEQERRQTILREAGNVDDIVDYQQRRLSDPSLPPLPDLLVIVDEFAELLAARPEFIDLFVGIGRVGRSLGIHLLLSSQRLDEGRLRGLESHLRYRICLRTYSSVESKLVLGTPDAYLLPSVPGLGYLKVDTSHYEQFRAAYSSAPAPAEVDLSQPLPVRVFDTQAVDQDEPVVAPVATGASELKLLVDRLAAGRERVHQVWVDPLSEAEPLDAVLDAPPFWRGGNPGLKATVGRLDLPAEQRTEPYTLDLTGAGGHVAIVGAPRTGKSTALRTLAASLILRHAPNQVQLYAIDLGGGALAPLRHAPHVGGIAGKLDREAIPRVVAQLRGEIEDRELLFRDRGWEGMRDARAAADGVPDIVLLVDGWEVFKREFEGLDRQVEELAAAGLSFGVHVVVAANRWAEIRPALLDNLGARLELRLNDAIDSLVNRKAAEALPDVAGRALTPGGLHVQLALPRVDGEHSDEGIGDALTMIARQAAEHWDGKRADPIRLLPRVLHSVPAPDEHGIAIGIEERALEPVRVDLLEGDPHLLVFGDAETGKSSLLRTLAHGLPDDVRLTVVDVRRSLADLADAAHQYATNTLQAQEAANALQRELFPRLTTPDPDGPRHVVLFDDYDLSTGPTGGPLAPLLDLVAVGRDIGLHVVLTRRVGGSARGLYEPVFARLRELGSPGLIMSGDPSEGALLPGVKAAPQPPGRGLLVRRGERPLLVQTVFTPAGHLAKEGAR